MLVYQKKYYAEYENHNHLRYLFHSDMVSYFQEKDN